MNNINPNTLNPFGLGFEYPHSDEIKAVINKSNYTGAQIGDLLGVNSRYVRAIQSGEERITFSEWQLLCALTGLIEIKQIPNGPKCFVTLFIKNGKLSATANIKTINKDFQIIGESTILIPFSVGNIQNYLTNLVNQVAQEDEPLKAFGKLSSERFEQAGGLSSIWKKKE